MKILVLAGGTSNERAVSKRSGANIAEALESLGYKVVRADPADPGFDLPQLAGDVDLVFPILHGAGGEDGVIQAELERLGKPFLGSGSEASRIAFNKVQFKEAMKKHDIHTPDWEVVNAENIKQSSLAKKPFVLKPISGGSSIDAFIVRDPAAWPAGIEEALLRYKEMLLEELVGGSEVTVPVLGSRALPLILIVPPDGEEFDYENKYNGKSQEITAPTKIGAAVQEKAQVLAVAVHNAIGCRHLSRTDIILQPNGTMTVLEINTIPGLTAESLFPKAAAAAGIDLKALVQEFVRLVQS